MNDVIEVKKKNICLKLKSDGEAINQIYFDALITFQFKNVMNKNFLFPCERDQFFFNDTLSSFYRH